MTVGTVMGVLGAAIFVGGIAHAIATGLRERREWNAQHPDVNV